jgi:hypothetical protein
MIALVLRTSTTRLSTTVALAMGLLLAAGLLSSRWRIQQILPIGFAMVVVVLWILPGVSSVLASATGGRDTSRPIGLVRHAMELWNALGQLPPDALLDRLEASRDRPHLSPLMREAARCGGRSNVLVWASPAYGDAAPPSQYMFQRSSYLLYPKKVFFAQRSEQLAELRREGPFSALIAYGAQPPEGVGGVVAYKDAPDFFVLCAPRL